MTKRMMLIMVLVIASIPLGGWLIPTTSHAGDWSINAWGGDSGYYSPAPRYYNYNYGYGYRQNRGYYPQYRPYNPVVRRDYYSEGGYAPDGTYHSEDVVEDRRASYYSPGRNQAVTPPRTSVQTWNQGPNRQTTRERTSWIGADGRPHSTTIDRTTSQDRWGNTHTDTHVTLKKKPAGGKTSGTSSSQASTPETSSTTTPSTTTPSAQTPSASPAAAPSASN